MRKEMILFLGFIIILFSTMQNCTSSRFHESNQNNGGQNLSDSPSFNLSQLEVLQSDQCVELVEGRYINKFSGENYLDNSVELPVDIIKVSDIPYQTSSGWDPQLSTLDLFTTLNWKNDMKKRPVIIFFHGGGNDGTDKSDLYTYAPKFSEIYLKKGFIFINANYRLFQSSRSPNTTSEMQVKDVAKVVKWVVDNVDKYGGDPTQIVLFGYSTTSHMVALINANHNYFINEGIPIDNLKATISIDSPYYNIPLSFELIKGTTLESNLNSLKSLYGFSYDEQILMSPTSYLINNLKVKPSLLMSSGWNDGDQQTVSYPATLNYKNELLINGYKVDFFHFDERTHSSLVNDNSDDQVNRIISSFLDRIFSYSALDQVVDIAERKRIFDSMNNTFLSSPNTPGVIYGYISNPVSLVVSCGVKSLFIDSRHSDFNTIFSIGSLTKIFTGLVLAKLVKENKIKLNDNITSMISNTSLSSILSPSNLTFKRIVTHTSGLSNMPFNLSEPRDINGDDLVDSVDPNNPSANYSISNLENCLNSVSPDPWIRCQPRPNVIDSYLYSNLGFGILSIVLQDQKINKFKNYLQFFREYFGIPLYMDDSFAEASEINQIINNYSVKNMSNNDIKSSLSILVKRFAGLHNFANDSITTPIEVPQPDMGILAGAGELKVSPQSLSKFLRLLLGIDKTYVYSFDIIDEFHRELYSDTSERIGYGVDIESHADGSAIYMKTGATKGSGRLFKVVTSSSKWNVILVNRNPNALFWENSGKLYNLFQDHFKTLRIYKSNLDSS